MSYFGVLLQFIVPPLLGIGLLVYWSRLRGRSLPPELRTFSPFVVLGVLVVVAVLYTTPWDNYLVATGVWWYDPNLVSGIVWGWVPLEEYIFFVLQTLFTGLWTILVAMHFPLHSQSVMQAHEHRPPDYFPNLPKLRIIVTAIVALLWLISTALLASGWSPATYLALELSWALLPIMLQCALGGDILWRHRQLIFWTLFPPTLYLCIVDSLAIRAGTWTIDPAQSLNLFVGNLPIEEVVFFFITNTLVVFGLLLILDQQSQSRAPKQFVDWLWRWMGTQDASFRRRELGL